MADETPEVVEAQTHDTRQSLADKLVALGEEFTKTTHSTGQAIRDSVQAVAGAVTGTVGDVRGGVQSLLGGGSDGGTPGQGLVGGLTGGIQSLATDATDQIKQAFDVTPAVREKPWQYVGGAVAVGFLTGYLFGPLKSSGAPSGGYQAFAGGGGGKPGLFDDLVKLLGQEVRKIGENAIQSLSKSVNKSVSAEVPKFVDSTVSKVVDGVSHPPEPAAPAPGYAAGFPRG